MVKRKMNRFEKLRFYMDKCSYPISMLSVYLSILISKINNVILKTYPLIYDCARCRDCGRNVHDFHVPDWLWNAVWGGPNGVLCYDCFANRADEKFGFKWRMSLKEEWYEIAK